jgi:glycosyltransferase involved in cell wall biosynthesis
VLLNALHSNGGGGFIYLQGILPHLAKDKRLRWTLLAPMTVLSKLEVPEGIEVEVAPRLGFASGHVWEQLVLPFRARLNGHAAMLCNANYVPLLARRPVPVLHTTADAGAAARNLAMAAYWRALKALTKLGLWRAPAFLALTPLLATEFSGPGGEWRARVAPPGLPAAAQMKAAPKEKGLILSVGDFYAQKDYPTLLRAMAQLRVSVPEARMMIVGRAVDMDVVNEVRGLIAELGLASRVKLAGGMLHAELMEVLAQADLLVSASRAESFNMPIAEAMALGTPVVCTDLPVRPYVAGDAVLAVPVGASPAAFAAAMERVLLDDTLAEEMAEKGRAQASKFNWKTTAKAIADTMVEVAQ